ncbi:MAG: acetate--CoA ligase family protein [Deltaproteobacteria bacterium]|nr:acetate--CoA ligase family protein [Deltaproteobacteria bacterium]
MMTQEMMELIEAAGRRGWMMEPAAKRLLELAGCPVPRYAVARSREEAGKAAREIGYPVIAKVVSPTIVHKSDVHGVELGIAGDDELLTAFDRLFALPDCQEVLIEESLRGTELIIGAVMDDQFGPMVMLGIGGTAVEVYHDVALRMAPLKEGDVQAMATSLKARKLIEGFRGQAPIDMEALAACLLRFSLLVMDLEPYIASADLNPVFCSSKGCTIADARFIMKN